MLLQQPRQVARRKIRHLNMPTAHSKETLDRQNIADLASEFAIGVGEVSALYDAQCKRLLLGAKVDRYLSIFAVRNVRQQLTQRRRLMGFR